MVVLDRDGRLVDGDGGVRGILAHTPELPRLLAAAVRAQGLQSGWSEHTLRVGDRTLRLRILIDPNLGEVVAFVAEEERPRELDLTALSPREREIARMVGAGSSDRQIARRLRIAVATVRWHLTNTYRKTELHDRAALQAAVVRLQRGARAAARERRSGLVAGRG